ncbi:MAG: Fe-S cluster assembly protein SufD [Halobacteriales archaeon]
MSVQEIDTEFIQELSDERDEPDWLRQRRLKAWESYDDLPAPNVIQTPGKRWTDLEELDLRSRGSATSGRESRTEIDADVPDNVVVATLEDAVRDHEELVRDNFDSVVRWDENSLLAVHAAAWRSGLFVYVPEGVEVDEPIRTTTHVDEDARFSTTVVVAEENATVKVAESVEGGDESYFSNVVEVVAGDGAEVNYGALQNLSDDSYQYTAKRGVTGRDASVNWIDGCFGTALTKSTVSTVIEGEGSDTRNYGLFFGTDSQHFDLETWTRHDAPNTTCDMFTRGVLDDRAVSAYEGTINVTQPAYEVDAYQTENVLLVSDEAEADASPRLEIDNHNVKCSHAATMGRIDDEELFYMGSRGVNDEEARSLIIEGYFEPVFGELPFPGLEDDFRELIHEKMESR